MKKGCLSQHHTQLSFNDLANSCLIYAEIYQIFDEDLLVIISRFKTAWKDKLVRETLPFQGVAALCSIFKLFSTEINLINPLMAKSDSRNHSEEL